jgi:DNA-binding SARP family transcriptional activator
MGEATMRFNVLGPLEIVADDGRVLNPKAPKVCQVLGLLLLRANEAVSADELVEELWGERPPRSALSTMQTYIYYARKLFGDDAAGPGGRVLLATRPPGYSMQVTACELDMVQFESLLADARASLAGGRPEAAVTALDQALGLWRGRPLANITGGPALAARAHRLEEVRLRAVELRIEALMLRGEHRDLVAELRTLIVAHPFHEWFHGQLIKALIRCGRRAEALESYRHLRRILSEELGVEPMPEIQLLRQEILAHRHAPAVTTARRPGAAHPARPAFRA